MKYTGLIFIYVLLLITPLYGRTVSLDEAIITAINHNPDLNISKLELEKQQIYVTQAKANILPSVSFVADKSKQKTFENKLNYTWTGIESTLVPVKINRNDIKFVVNQPLIDISFFPNLSAKKLSYKAYQANYKRKEKDIIFNVIKIYYEILKISQIKQIILQDIYYIEKYLKNIKDILALGFEEKQSTISIQITLQNKEQLLYRYNTEYYSLKTEFNRLLGYPQNYDFNLNLIQYRVRLQTLYENNFNKAWNNRSEVEELNFYKQAILKEKQSTVTGYLPKINLQVSYGFLNEDHFRTDKEDEYWTAGIRGSFDIFNKFSRTLQVKQINIKLKQIEAQIDQLSQEISLEIDECLFCLEMKEESYFNAIDNLELAKENLRNIENKFSKSHSTKKEILTAQLSVNDSNQDYILKKFDLLLEQKKYEYILGILWKTK
jgi:outer membrane protein TolC